MRFDWLLKLYAVYLVGYFFVKNGSSDFEAPIPVSWWFFSLLLLVTVVLEFVFFSKVQVKEQLLMSSKIELANRQLLINKSGRGKGKKA